MLFVSAGDDLHGPQVPTQIIEARGRLILEAYKQMGLDAMAIGERDREAKVDLGHVPNEALVTRAGIRVGTFALDLGEGDEKPLFALVSSKAERLRKRGAKLVVALLHGPDARAQKVLEAAAGVDVAVLAHDVTYATQVRRYGKAWVVSSPSQGKQAGILDLHVLDGKLAFQDAGQRAQMEVNLVDFERQLADITARAKTSDVKMQPMYEQQKQQVESMRANMRRQLAETPRLEGSWLEARTIPLGTDIADEPRVAKLVAKYKVDIAGLMPLPPPVVPGATVSAFGGVASCGGCHAAALAFWKKTKHARAWKTLVDQQQDKNPACVTCHITGGVLSLQDVQCEACHGPASPHIRAPGVKGVVRRDVPESVCVTCHTPNQGAFQFASFRAAIVGKGHGSR